MNSLNPLVSVEWLLEHLADPMVAIADCRFALAEPGLGKQQYIEGHIPGAYFFDLNADLSSPVEKHGGRHPLPDPQLLAVKLAQMGVDSEHPERSPLIVAYDASRFAFASRFWWLVRYLGYERVAVLDGGFNAWQRLGYPLNTEIPSAKTGQFIPRPRLDWVVDRDRVIERKDQPQVALVDAREGDRYRGEREPIDPVAGHIPGAVNYCWLEVSDEAGMMRSPQAQQAYWSTVTAEEVIVYCGSGVTACVNLLSRELAGLPPGTLYAGSWSDWCSYL